MSPLDAGTANSARYVLCATLCALLATACEAEELPLSPDDLVCPGSPARPAGWAIEPCGETRPIDPSAVGTLREFRVTGSALVCEWGLRCDGPVATAMQSYCHLGFAAHRHSDDGQYTESAGAACVRDLLQAASCSDALEAAFSCWLVASGGSYWDDSSLTAEECEELCGPGRSCIRGQCRHADGCSCESDDDCGDHHLCDEGRCRLARLNEPCNDGVCEHGLFCSTNRATPVCVRGLGAGEPCGPGMCVRSQCIDGVCAAQRPLGCGCSRDLDCPSDVSRCSDGVCVPRPMPGELCDPNGPPCFESACYVGQCSPFREGDGPCGRNSQCEEGLTCSPRRAPGGGLCGVPRSEGEACGQELPGGCAAPLECPTSPNPTCVPPAAVGESCEDRACAAGLSCDFDDLCVDRSSDED